ncbi:hypothetical protein [Lactiplantibacillus xiangfangensis]|uniref:hypothetical protein n=1 Tax=Lactiplantibacillus xiangfangensis TaxID=942150 RepID=UPI00070CF859|nr:hypothetical protein [Lactiplantibacillus xiangfangensis]
MNKKYGIHIYEKDNTPGFKDSYAYDEWFSSKEERDKQYTYYNKPSNPSPKDIVTEIDHPNYETTSYSLIEKEI